jgi:kinesin family member 15
MDLLDS